MSPNEAPVFEVGQRIVGRELDDAPEFTGRYLGPRKHQPDGPAHSVIDRDDADTGGWRANVKDDGYVAWYVLTSSLRALSAPPPAEAIPEDVAKLLAAARKVRPDVAVSKGRDGVLTLWRGRGTHGYFSPSHESGECLAHFVMKDDFGGAKRDELLVAFAEARAWPRADAERMVKGECPPSVESKGECFGAMPSEPPLTLPAGSRWHYDDGNYGTFTKPATLEHGYYYGDSDTNRGSQLRVQVSPRRVLWETVPKPSRDAPKKGASASAGSCGECGAKLGEGFVGGPRRKGRFCSVACLEALPAPCTHPRRFHSGTCVQCGELANESRGTYGISGSYESDAEAVARRASVTRVSETLSESGITMERFGGEQRSARHLHIDSRIASARAPSPQPVKSQPARGVRSEFGHGRVLDGHPDWWPEGSGE